MAEAPVDLSTGDHLEQKILQVLSDDGGPVKIGQLVKKCQVPKKTLNQVLYRLKKEDRVSSPEPATWRIGGAASGDGAPAIPEDSSAQPSLDERILRFLEANGPHRALHIAKALGMTTAKEVNPLLYSMRNKHLLSYDGQTWKIYHSRQEGQDIAHSGVTQESPAIICQHNPVNMICQQGANSHISIANSNAIQIGHGNVIVREKACGEPGPRTSHPLPLAWDASAQDMPPVAHGAQYIYMDKSLLQQVQLGHHNEMSLVGDAGKHPSYSFSDSPPEVSTTTADPGASFNMQTSEPGPHPEGDTVQTVHIKSCFLEDATIGNGNKMTIHLRSKGEVMESGYSEEPKKEDTGTSSEATPPRSCQHTPSDSMLPTSELRAMALGDSSPQTTEPVLREHEVQDTESSQDTGLSKQ
uniref:Z-DNA-binding protein 1 n=1 Tax=Mus spicilegus TaxID=10103 RepID=A0A8C6I6U2_MUSSI